MGSEWKPIEGVKWAGDDRLPSGCDVAILAVDCDDPSVPARMACWVRHWPAGRDYPVYRSCDLCDLDLTDEQMGLLPPPPGELT